MMMMMMMMKSGFFLLVALFLAACQSTPPDKPPAPFPDGTLIDLTYSFDKDTVFWPTAAGFRKTTDFEGITENGYYYTAYSFSTAEHGGTHLDAPIHFAEGRLTTDAIPLEKLMGPAVVVDVTAQAGNDADHLVSVADFERWETTHGVLPDNVIVLLRTGYGRFWPDRMRYMGTDERSADAVPKLHFPGLDPAAARWLVDHRSIKALGIDTPSIDYGQSSLFETHRVLFEENIPAFENVANLDQLPETGFAVIALPMKIKGGSGGPLRIVAVVPEAS